MKFHPYIIITGIGIFLLAILVFGLLNAWTGSDTQTAQFDEQTENISNSEVPKDKEKPNKGIIVFFLIINETGKDILLKAFVDGKELFTQEVGSEIKTKKHPREAPPFPSKYPAKELKVELRKDAKTMEVLETYSERKAVYDIMNFSKKAGGFRINVRENVISSVQDYFPIH